MYVIHFNQVHSPDRFLVIPILCLLAPSHSQSALLLFSCLFLMTLIVNMIDFRVSWEMGLEPPLWE